jgi:hypothetical protein
MFYGVIYVRIGNFDAINESLGADNELSMNDSVLCCRENQNGGKDLNNDSD